MKKSEKIEEEFSKWAENYGKVKYSFWEGDLSEEHRKAREKAIELLNPQKKDKVIDAGCGVGWGTITMADKVSSGMAYGVDITEEMILKSKKHAGKVDLNNVKFIKASVLNLPFEDNFFDGGITTHAAHHFYRPVDMFSELARVLKEGKQLIVVDNTGSSELIKDFEKKLVKEEESHYKFFELSEAEEILEKSGFKIKNSFIKEHDMYITAEVE